MDKALSLGYIEETYEALTIRDSEDPIELSAHRIFEWIGFRPSHDTHVQKSKLQLFEKFKKGPVSQDAHLLPKRAIDRLEERNTWAGPPTYHNPLPGVDVNDNTGREYLMHHPLAACSFATSIPLDLVDFAGLHYLVFPYWDTGVSRAITVHDVLSILYAQLDEVLDFDGAKTYVSEHGKCLTRQRWTILESYERLETLRDLFSACPLRELQFEWVDSDFGPIFSFQQV
ncbi:hypothetical protein C8Q80DRAFT_1266127 [Daedaleopsis nitida]|nr:hypothetical protein C8Q80DRAFT_1266127 [Daedaleopsis nitida]